MSHRPVSPFDYSLDQGLARPHDLLWVAPDALSPDAPGWALAALTAGEPCVVRRASREANRLPVGVRGRGRGQRHADWIDPLRIERRETPEALVLEGTVVGTQADVSLPALKILPVVVRIMDATGWPWGVTGAVGFQIASRRKVCHWTSDLDLIVRAPNPLARSTAAQLMGELSGLAARCDVQLETPAGGVALADWAGEAFQVLVKSDAGAFLATDPWAVDIPLPPWSVGVPA